MRDVTAPPQHHGAGNAAGDLYAPVTGPATEAPIHPRTELHLDRHLAFVIDDVSIQMAAVAHFGRRKKVVEARKVYVPQRLTDTVSREAFVSETIRAFHREFRRWPGRVYVGVSGSETACRAFFMPNLGRRQLQGAVRFEVSNQVPFPVEDCIFDYRPACRVTSGRHMRYKVALCAATKRLVNQTLDPFRELKVPVAAVHHVHDAIGQLLPHLPEFRDDTGMMLVNIGHSCIEMSFYRGASLEFSHITPSGLSSLSTDRDRGQYERLAEAVSTEILTAVDYYAGQQQGRSTDRIYVYGDLAYSSEMLELLNGHTGFEFVQFPAERLDFVNSENRSQIETLAVCLPALASAACNRRISDLLPEPYRELRQTRKVHVAGSISLALLSLGLGVAWMTGRHDTTLAREQLSNLTGQIEVFKSSDAYHTYNILKRRIADDRAFLESIQKVPSYLSLDLKELSLLTPPAIRLYRLSFDNEPPPAHVILQGVVVSDAPPPEVILAEYIENLNHSPLFADVALRKHVKRQVERGFEIDFQLEARGAA